MFSLEHFIWLGICAAFVAGMLIFSVKKELSLKHAGYIMTVICAFSEVSKMMCEMVEGEKGGMHLDPTALPFHLCSLMLFGVLYVTFGKDGPLKQTVMDFLAVGGTIGSFFALLIPTNGVDFGNILSYQCFVYHAGLMWFAFYLIAAKHAKLGAKALVKNLAILVSLVLIMIYVNSILSEYNTNFMYLVRPPMEDLPYLNLNSGWYVYFLRLVALGGAIILLFHLPFIISEKKKK